MKQKNMFRGAKPSTFRNADFLRRNPTEAEEILWHFLRDRQLENVKFRRQHPILEYVADFFVNELEFIIELDGGYHLKEEQRQYDLERETKLKLEQMTILRFPNEDVYYRIDYVLDTIRTKLTELKAMRKPKRRKRK